MPAGPPVALDTSSHSQPASQPASLRMTSKNNTIHVSSNVTLGASAGASKGGGSEGRLGTQVTQGACVHSKDGTCVVHGPGAKWRWRPIPVGRRTLGPDGKLCKREYFWKCEVGVGGRNLQQTRITFKKRSDDETKRDNEGTMGNQT